MSEDFEQLSRYRAGELSPDEARALEAQPGFAERLRQLDLLDSTARQLSVELHPEKVVELLAQVRRPAAREPSKLNFRVGLSVLALALAVIVYKSATQQGAPWTLLSSGDVQVDGRAAAPTQSLARGSTVRTGASGTAQLVSPGGWIGLPSGSELADPRGRGQQLVSGLAVVSADGLFLTAADAALEVHGVAVLSMEPAEGVARVTDTLNRTSPGDLMKTQWMKLSTVAMTAAAVGGGLTLFVVDGHASVRPGESAAPIEVKAGEQWKAGEARPTAFRAAAPQAALPEVAEAPKAPALAPGVTSNAELAKLTPPQLVAMVEHLTDEKESLLKQREELKKKLEGKDHPKQNYYRFSREELIEDAKKGELTIRGPQAGGQETKFDDKLRDELKLTPEEMAKATAIFESSTARAHQALQGFYKEIGGDPALGSTLGSDALFNEIREKSLKDDWTFAVRQAANERAGLAPPIANASPVLKAQRMLIGEDDRVINELEQLLGPDRAEQFLSSENFPHHRHGFGVGPAPAH